MNNIFKKIVIFCMVIFLFLNLLCFSATKYSIDDDLIKSISSNMDNYTTIDKIPDDLKKAVISMEDKRFYIHIGFDPISMIRAIGVNIKEKEIKQGASTITQQLAKNLFLTNEKNIKRKFKELILAIQLEMKYTKDEILEMYLNIVYFGNGAYGVESASEEYFNKHVEELSLQECAMLAGIIQSPSRYNPKANADLAKQRQELVLKVMNEK